MSDLCDPSNTWMLHHAAWEAAQSASLTFRDERCVKEACSQGLLLQPPALQASTPLLPIFLCFSEGGNIWKNSLFECYAPYQWQDGFCMLSHNITLWIITSQDHVFASNTHSAGISQFTSTRVATCTRLPILSSAGIKQHHVTFKIVMHMLRK